LAANQIRPDETSGLTKYRPYRLADSTLTRLLLCVRHRSKRKSRADARLGDKAGADATTRGIDETLQTISELELRRRFRVDPAEGPAIDLQEEGFKPQRGLGLPRCTT
jgi:hypothetical protein